MLIGLDIAWKKGFKRLIIQVDNKFVVDVLTGSNLLQRHGSNLIRCILLLDKKFEALRFEHIYREFNCRADYLAKFGLSGLEGYTRFEDCPIELSQIIVNDYASSSVRLIV